ncbi:hypothetical protein C0J52_17982 [Blattella germanica]|nr:hypothetical protein C0J52_17982 [Blattella germanica]
MLKSRRRSISSCTSNITQGVIICTVVTIEDHTGRTRDSAYTLSLINPHRKNSKGVRSRDRGSQEIGPARPLHLLGNTSSSKSRTRIAPSC